MENALQKNDIIELTVDNLGYDGEGVGHYDGQAIFIKGALPTERIRAKIILVKPRFCVAIIDKILSPSPHRVSAPCANFNKCGGCDIMHLDYPSQLAFKRDCVYNALKRVGGVEVSVDEVVGSDDTLGYRNKISLPVRRGKNGVEIGLFAKGSHRIVPLNACLLQNELTNKLIGVIKSWIEDENVSCYDENSGTGVVRHVVARQYGERLCVTVVATKLIKCDELVRRVKTLTENCEIFININRRHDNVILGDEWHAVYYNDKTENLDGVAATVHPGGFMQVNDGVRRKLYAYAASLCSGEIAIEAYSGAGFLSAMLAKKASTVYAIEINEHSHAAAVKLKTDNNLDNFFPICGDVSVELPKLMRKLSGENAFIVLDPPRTGISKQCVDTLLSSGCENIVYISCNPATLARDVNLLSAAYEVTKVTPFDMFPQTANVETVVCLARKT